MLVTSNFVVSHRVSTCLENFLPFSSKSKLSSLDSFSLEESKICHLGKGLPHVKILDFDKLKAFTGKILNTSNGNKYF